MIVFYILFFLRMDRLDLIQLIYKLVYIKVIDKMNRFFDFCDKNYLLYIENSMQLFEKKYLPICMIIIFKKLFEYLKFILICLI